MTACEMDIVLKDTALMLEADTSLIEQVRFASVSGKYKVYIIDEFHMLTTEAFNAILKTLEEPPEKVVFVLATTEAHKILPTIISRCQKFDFQRIPTPSLVTRLKFIADQENIKISDESILSIARKANGGLRDALSLLDQISSFSMDDGEISTELVNQVLGMVSSEFLVKLAESIAYKDHIELMKTLSQLLRAGNDPVVIITEVITFFRHLLVVKSAPDMIQFLEVPMSNIDNFKRVALMFGKDDILETLGFLNEAIEKVKKTQMAQLWLEINMVQLCKKPKTPDNNPPPNQNLAIEQAIHPVNASNISDETINSLLNKITYLEKKVDELSKKSFVQHERPTNYNPEHNNHGHQQTNQHSQAAEKKENKPASIN
ncbi:DNA polymerase III subunit gamma/tau, partial [bacterium]